MDVIIAIQFGIRHTSNACMIKHDQPKEFEEFNVVFDTKSNTQLQTKSHTTPTVALFDDNGGILSYGFEAELQNKEFNNASSHLLFREFIWDLFCSNETVPENLTAVNGRQMRSIDVVTAVLCHMVSHITKEAGLHGYPFTLNYVLTIPTCACEDSRAFMREATVKAGFSSGNIKIVEEAAAVLQFCLHDKQHTGVTTLDDDTCTCNRKYIVVECEEDYATMSVVQYINENMMEIVYNHSTEIWNGRKILCDFIDMICLETKDFLTKHPLEYYDFLREVKSKIRWISTCNSKLEIKISAVILEEIKSIEGMHGSLVKPDCKNEIEFKRDKCVIRSDRFQILFANAGTCIVDYIEEKLLTVFPDISYIILVGEFAQSPILHDIIKTSFSAKNIIIPCEANMAAVRGAVFFGQMSIAVETNTVHTMKQTPLNNAQAALAEQKGIEMRKKENSKIFQKKNKKKSPLKRCVIM